jgi:hypothetical protein
MTKPTVFISYNNDSPEHADRVLALADQLIKDGINCILDQYETSPPEGWPKWMDRHIAKSDFQDKHEGKSSVSIRVNPCPIPLAT